MTESRRWVVIPAAGVGKRMGTTTPKQYLKLLDRPVIDHTIEPLLCHPWIDGVYVAVTDGDPYWSETEFAQDPDLVRVAGGAERCHSVLNALHVLVDRAQTNDWVLVHDAVRPCVRRKDIDQLIQQVEVHNVGGLLGMPVRDTMKRIDADGCIVETVERQQLWHAFTPQMFRLGTLYQALQDAIKAGYWVTDEASAIEWAGFQPLMIRGQPDNIKITCPEDLALAEFYLSYNLSKAICE